MDPETLKKFLQAFPEESGKLASSESKEASYDNPAKLQTDANNIDEYIPTPDSSGPLPSEQPTPISDSDYPADIVENEEVPDGGYKVPLEFPNPAVLICFFDPELRDNLVSLHPWQLTTHEELSNAKPTQHNPYKFCLVAANGSGKDKYVVAPFAIWFCLCKIRSRCIITSSSGVQLTAQTETYIRDLADRVNNYFGTEVFRIRQRYIRCKLTGSEIRLFATDEKGKAEGYHPFDARSEMAIIVNEGKSVSEDIHGALRRCTGYNYWLEVSTPGEPTGFFYRAATSWEHMRRVTSYDCPHLSIADREEDKKELGEHSALFRSKHLALFTSIGGDVIITVDLVDGLVKFPPAVEYQDWPVRVGGDLAAGGDENSLVFTRGNKFLKEVSFRETDTTITADRIEAILISEKIAKDSEHLYFDDGGVGHAIIDMLVRRGWNIKRIINQSASTNKQMYGNKGAQNWYRVKRILEEKLFVLTGMSDKLINQLTTRRFKQTAGSGRIFLESKKEAKADGRPSPDRADAFILSLTGLTIDDFLKESKESEPKERPARKLTTEQELKSYFDEEVTYKNLNKTEEPKQKRIYGSLATLYGTNN
jgi:phage terminase large subunit